jgi:hypothetical protein
MFSLNLLAQINQQKRQVKQGRRSRQGLNNCWKMITSMLKNHLSLKRAARRLFHTEETREGKYTPV